MSLTDLKNILKLEYRSGIADLAKSFYVPCLANSVKYDRAVGYFTSDSLKFAARGLVNFVQKPGSKMRLVASPVLGDDDEAALRGKLPAERSSIIAQVVSKSFEAAVDQATCRHLEFMAWMIEQGKLEVKLAYRPSHKGIYHEKIGVFTDEAGVSVAFSGSANETGAALTINFESFDVFADWKDSERVELKKSAFVNLWSGNYNDLNVIDFTDATDALLKRYRRPEYSPPRTEEELSGMPSTAIEQHSVSNPERIAPLVIPDSLKDKIRGYQDNALKEWFIHDNRGVFAMATGTGKTLTALFGLARLQSAHPKLLVIVVAPYKHLCTQWAKDIRLFGVDPVMAFESVQAWSNELRAAIIRQSEADGDASVVVCTTNDTLQSTEFLRCINRAKVPLCVVGDEVHNLGAPEVSKVLPEAARFRLGLSATPVRQDDDEGTEAIFSYFGKTIFEFTLENAISGGFLTPYDYNPVFVSLTDFEAAEYVSLTRDYAKLAFSKDPKYRKMAENILFKRSRLVGAAFGKTKALIDLIGRSPMRRGLVYCGEGNVRDPDGNDQGRQIDLIVQTLRNLNPPIPIDEFVHDVSSEDRQGIIKNLTSGKLHGVAAIKCLDEGVDVPCLEQAFILASTKNYRQSVQRRGRLLRLFKDKKKAVLYDFVILPPTFSGTESPDVLEWERKLIESELQRCEEFARLALNKDEVMGLLVALRNKGNNK